MEVSSSQKLGFLLSLLVFSVFWWKPDDSVGAAAVNATFPSQCSIDIIDFLVKHPFITPKKALICKTFRLFSPSVVLHLYFMKLTLACQTKYLPK